MESSASPLHRNSRRTSATPNSRPGLFLDRCAGKEKVCVSFPEDTMFSGSSLDNTDQKLSSTTVLQGQALQNSFNRQ